MPYVYQYIDSITGLPFYIGKGTGRRKDAHLCEAKARISGNAPRGRPSYCVNKIISLLKAGHQPSIEVIKDDLTDDEAYTLEQDLVKKYGRKNLDEDGILSNRALGGLGGRGHKLSADRIQQIIECNHAQKGKPKPGLRDYIAANPEKHISRRQTGTFRSAEAKANMSAVQTAMQVGAKILTFRSPSGEITRTKEWRAFLEINGLSYNLVRGKGKVYTKGPNAGWSVVAVEWFKPECRLG